MRAGVIIGLLLFSFAASAAPDVRLGAAVKLYHRGSYEEAIKALLPIVADEKVDEDDRIRARQYLAAAFFSNGEQAAARKELVSLARAHPHSRLDPGEFIPELILLEREAHAQVDEELKAERERKAKLAASQPPEEPPAQVIAPAEPKEPERGLRIQGGAFGFSDVFNRSIGAGAAAGVSFARFDAGARLLIGPNIGAGIELGYRFLDTMITPRVALRGTTVPGIGVFGGGLVAGVRADITEHLFATVDAAFEGYAVPDGYEPLAIPITAGLNFSL